MLIHKTTGEIKDSALVKCLVWDTAGSPMFRSVLPLYFRAAHGIVLVYNAANL
jgi:GTPase SAR1 family protein